MLLGSWYCWQKGRIPHQAPGHLCQPVGVEGLQHTKAQREDPGRPRRTVGMLKGRSMGRSPEKTDRVGTLKALEAELFGVKQ